MYFKIVQCYVNKNEMIPKITLYLIIFFRYKVLGMVLKEMVRKFMVSIVVTVFRIFRKNQYLFYINKLKL